LIPPALKNFTKDLEIRHSFERPVPLTHSDEADDVALNRDEARKPDMFFWS